MVRINDLLPNQKPIERLEQYGAQSLSIAELLAIVIGSGTREQNALDLANTVLQTVKRSANEWQVDEMDSDVSGEAKYLEALQNSSLQGLMQVHGIGRTKAVRILAACQLANKLKQQVQLLPRVPCENPVQIASHLDSILDLNEREYFYVLFLDSKLRLIRMKQLSEGGIRDCSISPRELYRQGLKENASTMILVHNHPSGDTNPSDADWKTTEYLIQMGLEIGLPILDHLVLASGARFTSMRRMRPDQFVKPPLH